MRKPIAYSLAALTFVGLSLPALAWKPYTHVYLAEQAIQEVLQKGEITIYLVNGYTGERQEILGTFKVDPELRVAVEKNRDAYRAGLLGPDAYPDILTGQQVIHPHADHWLPAIEKLRSTTNPREKAFLLGYITHAAQDMFAHDYVNQFTGAPFTIKPLENALGHMIIESYVEKRTPPLTDLAFSTSSLQGFIWNNFVDCETLRNGHDRDFSVVYGLMLIKDTLNKEITYFDKQVADLKTEVKKATDVKSRLEAERDTLASEIESVEKDIKDVLSIIADPTTVLDLDKLKEKAEQLKQRREATLKRRVAVISEITTNQARIAELSAKVSHLVLLNEYAVHWKDDINKRGVKLIKFSDDIARKILLSPDKKMHVDAQLKKICHDFAETDFAKMLGVPDAAADIGHALSSFQREVIDKTGVDFLEEVLHEGEFKLIDYCLKRKYGRNVSETRSDMENPHQSLGKYNVDIAKFNQELGITDDSAYEKPDRYFDYQKFRPAYNSFLISQLLFLKTSELNQLAQDLGGGSALVDGQDALTGYLSSMDGLPVKEKPQWETRERIFVDRGESVFTSLFMLQRPGIDSPMGKLSVGPGGKGRVKLDFKLAGDAEQHAAKIAIWQKSPGEKKFVRIDTFEPPASPHEQPVKYRHVPYSYKVRALYHPKDEARLVWSPFSENITFQELTVPAPVTDVTVRPSQEEPGLLISWTLPPSEVDQIEITRTSGTGDSQSILSVPLTGTLGSHLDKVPIRDKETYTYHIRVHNPAGWSQSADQAVVIPDRTPALQKPVPVPLPAAGFTLAWTSNPFGKVQRFEIEKTLEGSATPLPLITTQGSPYSDSDCLPNFTYSYRVRQVDSLGSSDFSGLEKQTTESVTPLALQETAANDGIGLSWINPVYPNGTTLEVWWSDESDNRHKALKKSGIPANTTSFIDMEGLKQGQRNYYSIRAVNGGQPYKWAHFKEVSLADSAPKNLSLSRASDGAFLINWDDVTTAAQFHYQILRTDQSSKKTKVFTLNKGEKPFRDDTGSLAASYQYSVRVVNGTGPVPEDSSTSRLFSTWTVLSTKVSFDRAFLSQGKARLLELNQATNFTEAGSNTVFKLLPHDRVVQMGSDQAGNWNVVTAEGKKGVIKADTQVIVLLSDILGWGSASGKDLHAGFVTLTKEPKEPSAEAVKLNYGEIVVMVGKTKDHLYYKVCRFKGAGPLPDAGFIQEGYFEPRFP